MRSIDRRAKLRFVIFQTLIDAACVAGIIGRCRASPSSTAASISATRRPGRRAYLRGAHSRSALCGPEPGPVGARDAQLRPPPAARATGFRRHASDELGIGHRHARSSPTTTAMAPSPPGCGGCCAGWGIAAAAVLDGGLKAWTAAGGTLAVGEETAAPRCRPRRILSAASMQHAVIDSRRGRALLARPRAPAGRRARRRALRRAWSNPSTPWPATSRAR